jgi:mRNA-degrading endonuclease RelE of RelBE toxin-antitoxin system
MYAIAIVPSALDELALLRPFDRRRVAEAIEERLAREPLQQARHRKPLPGIVPPFEHVPPLWELRVGDYRVFYDVDDAERLVTIRAIRAKGRKTTDEVM